MKNPAAAGLALCMVLTPAAPAFAEWRIDNGVAIVAPASTNSTIELLAVSCGDPYQVEVYSRGGPVRPDAAGAPAELDYFYKPGKVEARIDGRVFAFAAAGSDAAVVLFAQGKAADNHLAPVTRAFIEALGAGTALTLAFDIVPGTDAPDGTPHETAAEFPLAGSRAALEDALASCR